MATPDLADRVARLERANRRWQAGAALIAAACFAIGHFGQADDPDRPQPLVPESRRVIGLSAVPAEGGGETLYRLWSDGAVERQRAPIFDFRGNDKWDLLRRP